MERNNYRKKLGSMLLQRLAIEEKMTKLETLRKEEIDKGIYSGPATILYFELFNERYDLNAKIGKLEDKYHKDGFTAIQWCEDYNMYVNMYNLEV